MTTITQVQSLEFVNPAWAHQRKYLDANAVRCRRTLHGGEGRGLTVLICGAGPSLKDTFLPTYAETSPDAVWGCNSALRWLWQEKLPVSHGFACAGEEGLLDDWKPFPPVQYYVSSGIWPVIPQLLDRRHRRVWFYHVILSRKAGFADESAERTYYAKHYLSALCVMPTGGFNVTNIAVAVALGMGFARILVAGADCCLALSPEPRPDQEDGTLDDAAYAEANLAWKGRQRMYVDGRDPVTAFGPNVVIPDGVIAGRRFASRPDMLLSAVHLVRLAQRFRHQVELVGDTLPNWLLRVPEPEWIDLMPRVEGETVGNFKPVLANPSEKA